MDIGTVDYWAVSGRSYLHRSSTVGKLCAAALLLAGVMVSQDLFVLLAVYLATAAAVAATGLPALRILGIAAYPALFAVLFAVSQWNGTLHAPAVVIVKALAAALVMATLTVTTPYPQLFAAFRTVLPRVIADALLLTYRSLFILLDILGNMLTAMRLRGGLTRGRLVSSVRNISDGLGLLLVRALALAERFHDVLQLRGYSGRLFTDSSWKRLRALDLMVLLPALLLFVIALAIRYEPEASSYNGYPLLAAALTLVCTVMVRWKKSST